MIKLNFRFSNYLLCVLLVLASTAIIVFCLPREKGFAYDYTVGKPWKYGQMIAEYDFPIYKNEATFKAEVDSVLQGFQPYFFLNESVAKTQIQNFVTDAQSGTFGDISKSEIKYIREELEDAYAGGLLDTHSFTMMSDSGWQSIRIVRDNIAYAQDVKSLRSTRQAYMQIRQHADSLHFATEILDRCNLDEYLSANLTYDLGKTESERNYLESSVSYAKGMVQAEEKIVDRGEIVTDHIASIIESMKKEYDKRNEKRDGDWFRILGQCVICLFLLTIFCVYLFLYHPEYTRKSRYLCFLFFMVTLFPVITSILAQTHPQAIFMIPLAIVAIFTAVFLDSQTAMRTHLLTLLLSTLALQDAYVFIMVQFISGVVACYSLKDLTSRSQLIRSAFIATAAGEAFLLALELCQGHSFGMLDTTWYINTAFCGILLLFAYPTIFVLEKLFGFISPVTLLELSNTNHPLLRELTKQAQGTFNHSMQVANLAVEVADKLGADALLVRTAALYHDIGKIKNASYFTENQMNINPHDSLSEKSSAQVIIQHVTDGLQLANKYHLPQKLKDFIATHHGLSKASYFYIKYRNAHPDEEVDEKLFTYPGPNPFTKEQAILMMADSVEAASKSLKTIDNDSLKNLVDNIIDGKVKEGYFQNCPITYADITLTKEVLLASLKTIYHTRISYPKLGETEEQSTDMGIENKKFMFKRRRKNTQDYRNF